MEIVNQAIVFGKYSVKFNEIRDLLISAAVLGIIFSISKLGAPFSIGAFLIQFLVSAIVLTPSLILHEMAHKFMAQRYELRAEYVLWPVGVALSIVAAMAGFIVAALGSVMIEMPYKARLGHKFIGITIAENGKISAVGPLTNYALSILSYSLAYFFPAGSIFYSVLIFSGMINAILGLFNSLPFPPLDGSKIIGWNLPIFLGMIISGIALYFIPGIIPGMLGVLITIGVVLVSMVIFFILVQKFLPVQQQLSSDY